MPRRTLLNPGEIDLAAAVRRREVIPFLGAGFSIEAFQSTPGAPPIPSWETFVDRLVAACGHEPLGKAKNVFDSAYPELLQVVLDNTGSGGPIREVIDSFFTRDERYRRVAEQAGIAKLLRLLSPPFVLTTNYDGLLECVWPEAVPLYLPHDLAAAIDVVAASVRGERETQAVIKLHGTGDSTVGATVTSNDYRRLYAESDSVQELLSKVAEHYSIWFLGYSVRDIDVQSALLRAQVQYPHRQHFRHALKFSHPLEPRVEHLRYNIRLFGLHPEKLTRRVEAVAAVAKRFDQPPCRMGVFRPKAHLFQEQCLILSRFELEHSENHGRSLTDSWIAEIGEVTDDFRAPLQRKQWDRFFSAERVLRHHLHLSSRFAERKALARYVSRMLPDIPRQFAPDAASVIAEGLCYLENDSTALDQARSLMKEASHDSTPWNPVEIARAHALIARSTAKWSQGPRKLELLRDAVRLSALAATPELQAACLLDVAKLSVDALVENALEITDRSAQEDGVIAARAAMELALFGGSYRRASLALQRLAFLDDRVDARWSDRAYRLWTERRLPNEPRARLYLDLCRAVTEWRRRQSPRALRILSHYDPDWFLANQCDHTDHEFHSRVQATISSRAFR